MNYFPFHIGDFAAHTAHLSFEEDIAYRRMLDWYYLNEKALPLDAGKVARLIRMPKSLPAIQVVLDEFFVKSTDGWHNKRADEELSEMQAKQEQRAIKDEHEAERMRRYRERRAAMFAALREAGVVPAWDLPMKELQRLHEANCNAPATHLQREQVVSCNAPATAIPIANSQQPIANSQQPKEEEANASVASKLPTCPVEAIISSYHEALPELPAVRMLGDPRRKAITAFWRWVLTSKRTDGAPRAQTAEHALAWIRAYFERAHDNDFLMGRTERFGAHSGWRCDFDFLLTEKGKRHVIEKTEAYA